MSPCFVLAAICGPSAEPPPDSVRPQPQPTVELRLTSADDGGAKLLEDELRRELSDRLLQDGYRVVPGGRAASVAIWVHLGPEGARVRAHGVEERVETIPAGDPEVVAFEVLQLTTALVDEVRPLEPLEPADRPAVALHVAGSGTDPELREWLQVGLLERGYALTRTPRPADARLCVVAAGGELRVHATGGDGACEAEAAGSRVAAAETIELRRVLLLDEAAAALEERAAEVEARTTAATSRSEGEASTGPAEAAEAEVPVPSPARTAAVPEPRDEARAPSVALTVHGGFVARAGGPDGAFGLRLRAGRRRGPGGGLELTVVPSAGEGVRIVESMPAAVFDWTLGFGRRGIAGFGAFAGVHVHAFRRTGYVDDGVRLAPSLGTTVRLGILGTRGLVAFGGLRAGWSGGRWVHLFDGETTWERSGLLVGLELGAGWDFPWRRS